ncbi:hypothetical protein GNI_106240 [Gregarina niphandrodes]|uniref:Uncharacterized protein n=1 Tax=Gregarina niphandrodes TaxID=110365 RepID=A0A023B3V6_GRENI|nr:hypothetical protein GNI_106240 [Gregarina niphandrodes]EZG56029.1 hypothetical protein GNI_106240 [Gregarina niphandrodes]|eukprot:XP_011131370.1 hypothetical protein GNI_106240 [Gregarina niphandrodes]
MAFGMLLAAKEAKLEAKMKEELEAKLEMLRRPAIAHSTPGAISDNPRTDASTQLAAKAFDVEYRTPHLALDDAFQLFAQVAASKERVDESQSSGFESRLLKSGESAGRRVAWDTLWCLRRTRLVIVTTGVIETSYFRLNFALSLFSDTSAKMPKRKSTLRRPLQAISTRDAFANLQLPVTLSEAASPGYCVSFGRLMWKALFGAVGDDVDAADLKKFAADKIAAYGSLNTEGACFATTAILGVLRIRPPVAIVALMSHDMATLLHVFDD